jgi:hypothetical protein
MFTSIASHPKKLALSFSQSSKLLSRNFSIHPLKWPTTTTLVRAFTFLFEFSMNDFQFQMQKKDRKSCTIFHQTLSAATNYLQILKSFETQHSNSKGIKNLQNHHSDLVFPSHPSAILKFHRISRFLLRSTIKP